MRPAEPGGGPSRGRVAAEEQGWRRLARELHDDLGQRLAALGLELKAVRKQVAEDDPRRPELDALGAGLAEVGEDLRRLSHDLHPAALERRGLAEALRDLAAETERRSGLPVRLALQGAEVPLLPETALGLYRIAQEGLGNAVRHAGARAVFVTLAATRDTVRLTIADDGRGFDPGIARRGDGLGLASMEERAALLGGSCRVASSSGGTRVEVAVPRPDLRSLSWFLRRHRGLVAAAAVVVLALAGGLAATLREERLARQEAARADAAARFLEDLFRAADPREARGRMPGARELLKRGTARLARERELRDHPLTRARLLDILGGIHTELGLYDEARPLLEEALAIRERRLGPQDLATAATVAHLGTLASQSGKGDAAALFRRALAIREARLGEDDPERPALLGDLGTALAARGRFDEAEGALRRALALGERRWGKDDLRVARVLHNLSGIAYYRKRTDEAERLAARALAIREKVLPPDDPDLAGSREALALFLRRRGHRAEAAALLERVVAAAERVYGPAHPSYARALLNLGQVRQELGDDAGARSRMERALAICEKALAPDHPLLLRAIDSLADLHLQAGRYALAEPLYRRLWKLHEGGASYADWSEPLGGFARLLRATGRNDEAARVEARAAR